MTVYCELCQLCTTVVFTILLCPMLWHHNVTQNPEPPPGGEGEEQQEPEGEEVQDLREFSQSTTERETGPPLNLEQSFLDRTKVHLDAIEEQYSQILPLRKEIDDLLGGFKQRLRVGGTTPLSGCFKHLRGLVGHYETLTLNQEDMKIVIGEEAEEDAKEAVEKFNFMLEKCVEFPERLEGAKTVVQERIVALERERIQTQATIDAVERAKKQLDDLHTWGDDIENIKKGTRSASGHLASKVLATGMVVRLED